MTVSFTDSLRDLARLATESADRLESEIAIAFEMTRTTIANGGTLLFCGNGGSAADAQHLAT